MREPEYIKGDYSLIHKLTEKWLKELRRGSPFSNQQY